MMELGVEPFNGPVMVAVKEIVDPRAVGLPAVGLITIEGAVLGAVAV